MKRCLFVALIFLFLIGCEKDFSPIPKSPEQQELEHEPIVYLPIGIDTLDSNE